MAAGALALFLLAAGIFWASRGRTHPDARLKVRSEVRRPRHVLPESGQKTSFRLVSYNMGYASGRFNNLSLIPASETAENLSRMRASLKDLDADLWLLQEVDFLSKRSGRQDQLQELMRGLDPAEWCTASVMTWDKRYVPFPYWPVRHHFGSVQSGQAIASRFEIGRTRVHTFEKPRENPWYRNLFYLDRIALATELELGGGKRLVVVNVHLEAFVAEARARQARELRDWLEATWTNQPLVVAGDFNADLGDPALGPLFEGGFLRRPAPIAPLTFPSWNPESALDHVLISRSLEVRSYSTHEIPGSPSDHLPIVADLSLS